MTTKYLLDGSEPPADLGGRPPAPKPEHIAFSHHIMKEPAQANLLKIANE
jgi:putative transposase